MTLSKLLREYLDQRLAQAKTGYPGNLSPDGRAVRLHGGIGCDCYFSPDGDVILAVYEIDGTDSQYDRSKRARSTALSMSLPNHPLLAELLPVRTESAVTCSACAGKGFTDVGTLRRFLVCHECCGLGWTSPTIFDDPTETTMTLPSVPFPKTR